MTVEEINAAIQAGKDEAEKRMRAYREFMAYKEQHQALRRMSKKKAFKGIAIP